MKTNPNDPAQPVYGGYQSNGDYDDPRNKILQGGLSKREHFASIVTGDFYSLTRMQQEMIAGKAPFDHDKDFAVWLAKGRALWRLMQADALIEALNKEI